VVAPPPFRKIEVTDAKKMAGITSVTLQLLPDSMASSDAQTPRLLVDRRGRYYQKNWRDRRIYVFDSAGQLLASFGGSGKRAGEFDSFFEAALGDGDSIHTFEHSGRHQVFAPDHAPVRSADAPDLASVLPLRPGVFAAVIRYPLDYVEPSGGSQRTRLAISRNLQFSTIAILEDGKEQSVRTFGTPVLDDRGGRLEAGRTQPRRASLCRSPTGTIWSPLFWIPHRGYQKLPYEVEEFDEGGRRLRLVLRTADWGVLPEGGVKPLPVLRWCSVDARGRLWVYGYAPIEDTARIRSHTRMYDTVVEVIDLSVGRVVAAHRFDAQFLGVLDGQRVFTVRENGGKRQIEVLQLNAE
jgi:hypothetical protein